MDHEHDYWLTPSGALVCTCGQPHTRTEKGNAVPVTNNEDREALTIAQLLNSRQLWGKLHADPDDWAESITDDEREWHLETAHAILAARRPPVSGDTSDGHHTFDELYDYRMLYNAHAAQGWLAAGIPVVKSWRHSDGELAFDGGWFVVSARLPTGQVTNHYKTENWDLFDVPEVEQAPTWDGHTPPVAAERLRAALSASQPREVEVTDRTEWEELTLIARDVHLYDGGENQAILGLDAGRIAKAILAAGYHKIEVTDDMVKRGQQAWTLSMSRAEGYRKAMHAALSAALGGGE